MFFQASSKMFICVIERIQMEPSDNIHAQLNGEIDGKGSVLRFSDGMKVGDGSLMISGGRLSVIMASHSNQQLDNSVTDHFSPNSPYNVAPIPGRATSRSQVRMHDIQALPRYYGINHPILSAEKKVIIEEKLKLDEKVRGELSNRLKDENYFAKFHRNPFSFTQNVSPSPSDLLEEEQRRKRRAKNMQYRHFMQTAKENIVEAVNELKNNDFFRELSPLQNNIVYSKMASLMLKNASESQLYRPVKLVRDSREEVLRKEMTIDDIVAMQDQNFYAANIGKINIFQVMNGTHRPFLTRQKLDKYRFSFMHIVERINTIKVPFLRELSRVGRELMQERTAKKYDRIDYVSSAEMAVKYGEINLGDLLSLASGRFSPEIAYAAANEGDVRKDFSPNSSEIGQVQILYNSRLRHKQLNCQNVSQQRNQIKAYHYIENTPEEAKIDRFCGKFQAKIREDLELRRKLLGNTIRDKGIHGKIQASVQENIAYLANMNKRRKGTSTDRLISQNKINKNRKERLQIKHLLQSIQLKNRQEDKIRQLLNP